MYEEANFTQTEVYETLCLRFTQLISSGSVSGPKRLRGSASIIYGESGFERICVHVFLCFQEFAGKHVK